jgi:hypothetical protein
MLAVTREWRRRGIAWKLAEIAIEALRRMGLKEVCPTSSSLLVVYQFLWSPPNPFDLYQSCLFRPSVCLQSTLLSAVRHALSSVPCSSPSIQYHVSVVSAIASSYRSPLDARSRPPPAGHARNGSRQYFLPTALLQDGLSAYRAIIPFLFEPERRVGTVRLKLAPLGVVQKWEGRRDAHAKRRKVPC